MSSSAFRVTDRRHRVRLAGISIAETMVAAAILSTIMAALMIGISTVQKTFRASQHHAKSQIEQARIVDYVGRDVRRAKTVFVDTYDGGERLRLTIPDYYQSGAKTEYNINDTPRTPYLFNNKEVRYSNTDVPITYFRRGTTIYRSVNGVDTPLVTDVEDFKLTFPKAAASSQVKISVKFRPRYSFRGGNQSAEDGTTVEATVLLRNLKR